MRFLGWAFLGVACATAPAPIPRPAVTQFQMEPLRFEAQRVGTKIEVVLVDAESLFDDASLRLSVRDFEGAIAQYDRLIREFGDSRFVSGALYNEGLAHEGNGDWLGAARCYQTLVDRFPGTPDAWDAEFRLGGAYAETRDFSESSKIFARIAERASLGLTDRIEALARWGYARVHMGDLDGAEAPLRRALAEHQRFEFSERLETPFFLAMAHYYLAKIGHERFRVAPIRLPEEQMAIDIDEKARLLLDAHAAYIDTIRAKDPTWATAAGVELATLYREFYDALLAAPIPTHLTGEARDLYVELLRKNEKLQTLLEKAISVYEKTLLMAERVGVRNTWVDRAMKEIETVRHLLRNDPSPSLPAEPRPTVPSETPPPSFVL